MTIGRTAIFAFLVQACAVKTTCDVTTIDSALQRASETDWRDNASPLIAALGDACAVPGLQFATRPHHQQSTFFVQTTIDAPKHWDAACAIGTAVFEPPEPPTASEAPDYRAFDRCELASMDITQTMFDGWGSDWPMRVQAMSVARRLDDERRSAVTAIVGNPTPKPTVILDNLQAAEPITGEGIRPSLSYSSFGWATGEGGLATLRGHATCEVLGLRWGSPLYFASIRSSESSTVRSQELFRDVTHPLEQCQFDIYLESGFQVESDSLGPCEPSEMPSCARLGSYCWNQGTAEPGKCSFVDSIPPGEFVATLEGHLPIEAGRFLSIDLIYQRVNLQRHPHTSMC